MQHLHSSIRRMILFLLVTAAMTLFAEDIHTLHVIDSYTFDIPGKTWETVVRRDIIPEGGDPPFLSIEELEDALEQKRRTLFNMRIFNDVSYTYELVEQRDDSFLYQVTFYIDDSFTFLPIPYAKFDSNYGMRAGFRLYERNLLGSFSDLFFYAMATQRQIDSWGELDFESDLSIDNIPIGKSTLDVSGRVNFILHEGREISDARMRGRVTVHDIHILNNTLSISAFMQMEEVDRDEADQPIWGDGEIRLSTDIGRVRLFKQPFRFHHSFTLEQTDDTWEYPVFRSFLRFTWLDLTFLGHGYSVIFSSDQRIGLREDFRFNLERNRFTAQLRSKFDLPFKLTYTPSVSTTFEMAHIFFVPDNFMVSTHHAFTRGSINWNNNMREGSRFSLQLDGDLILEGKIEEFADRFNYTAALSYTGFWLPFNWLNLSFRTMGFYAHRPLASQGDLKIPDDYREFPTFIPGSSQTPAQQMRGILLKDLDDGANRRRKAGAVANLDIMIMPVKIKGFAEGFGTLFFDVGVFDRVRETNDSLSTNLISADDLDVFYTVGIEIRGILDRFRSYPVRASIGVDLKDLKKYLEGDLDSWRKIGNEITISMELFY